MKVTNARVFAVELSEGGPPDGFTVEMVKATVSGVEIIANWGKSILSIHLLDVRNVTQVIAVESRVNESLRVVHQSNVNSSNKANRSWILELIVGTWIPGEYHGQLPQVLEAINSVLEFLRM
jgi:hypothetical protein